MQDLISRVPPYSEERVPPYSEEAERATLGSLLLEPDRVLPMCFDADLEPESFYVPAHRLVYRAITWLHRVNKPIDIQLVVDALHSHGKLDMAGGETFVHLLVDATPTASHAEHYIEMVGQHWMLRQVITACREAEQLARDTSISPTTVVADVIQRFTRLRGCARNNESKKEAWAAVMRMAEDAKFGRLPGLPSPWRINDKTMGGAPYGLVTLIAGRGGTRKSYLANQWVTYAALERQIPGAYFPLEDGIERAMQRSACIFADVNAWYFMRGKCSQAEIDLVNEAGTRIIDSPLDIIGGRGRRVDDIALEIARGVAKNGWRFVLIDAFKDIRKEEGGDIGSDEVYKSSRLCDIADKHKVALMVVHHIRKQVGEDDGHSSKQNQFISLLDIKGRGEITDDARMVYMLQCEKYRKPDGSPGLKNFKLDVQKNTNGPQGALDLELNEDTGRFTEKETRQ